MNTLLKSLSLVFAVALPLLIAADMSSIPLPSLVNIPNAFTGFALSIGLLTITTDYRRPKPLTIGSGRTAPLPSRSTFPLAA